MKPDQICEYLLDKRYSEVELENIVDGSLSEDEDDNLKTSLYLLAINNQAELAKTLIKKIDITSFNSPSSHFHLLWDVANPRDSNEGDQNPSFVIVKELIEAGISVFDVNQGRDAFSEIAKQAGGHPRTDAALLRTFLETGQVIGFRENNAEILSDLENESFLPQALKILKTLERDASKSIENRAIDYRVAKREFLATQSPEDKEKNSSANSPRRSSKISPTHRDGFFDNIEDEFPLTTERQKPINSNYLPVPEIFDESARDENKPSTSAKPKSGKGKGKTFSGCEIS